MSTADQWLFVLQPPVFPPPPLERFLPLAGPVAFLILLLRLLYSIAVSPLVLLSSILPPSLTGLRHPSWTLRTTLFARLVSQLAWCANYGLLFSYVEPAADVIPRRSMESYAKPMGISVSSVRVDSSYRGFQRGILADEMFMLGEDVQGFWLEHGKKTDEELGRRAAPGEKVLLFFVGGAYVVGHPLMAPIAFELAKATKCRVFCANYRKARDAQTAFPVALHEAVAGWTRMLKRGFRPENIYVVGNSAGGGLAVTLTLYLSLSKFFIPAGVILISPWLDLTMSNRTIRMKRGTDLLGDGLIQTGSRLYLQNFPRPAKNRPRSSDTEYLLSKESFDEVGASHPLLSPSLIGGPSPILSALAAKPKFLIAYGGAERLAGEIESFIIALKRSDVHVEVDEEVGAWHDTASLPLGIWDQQAKRLMRKVVKFIGVDGAK